MYRNSYNFINTYKVYAYLESRLRLIDGLILNMIFNITYRGRFHKYNYLYLFLTFKQDMLRNYNIIINNIIQNIIVLFK